MKPVRTAQEEDACSCRFPEEEEGECELWPEIQKAVGKLLRRIKGQIHMTLFSYFYTENHHPR